MVVVDLAVFAVVAFRQVILNARALSIRYRLNDDVYQWIRALPKVRTAAAEPFVFDRWLTRTGQVQSPRSRSDRIQGVVSAFGTAAVTASVLLAYYLLSGPIRGDLDDAEVVSWVAAYTGLLAAVLQLGGLSENIGIMVSVKRRLNPLLESKTEDYAQGAPLPPRGDICFDRASFSYGVDDVPAVQDISFRVSPGEFVAMVGPSGYGKSTLLRLLPGFESPASGSITVGGQELADINMPGLRRQCGVVLQDALPFAGTIFDNIQGSGHLTWSQAWAAARAAGLEEDIRRMPMGMSTVLLDGGAGLSGGQRQRRMLAQALAKQPAIVVLDEATSALDNRTQERVSASIGALHVTRIVVAHRLSTVMTADRVLVMRDGRIIEEGSPDSLIQAEHGEFRDLVRHQLG
ncbi:ATP-binding cassette domain-containing protein [Amycolatopsis pithecellobii]|uniref:ATP-binding cassette domain-containing protein n=1 Tax=Amycolatopsis pithecellobii TaxID=664692 RepID=A0A6N7Z385_9PSEU|nr:ATP-binding cassette domain-containing protein [Amycolatopsis pithecellobii]MTD55529.1 ATP-binding cassette domain-containing protein [Amycolatopsis pithecellobii]